MSNDFTIKVSLDFDEKDIGKLREDVQKAVNSGSRSASPTGSGSRVISRKISEIESEASSSIYKYGTNHIKTKSIISDLAAAKRAEHYENVFGEREKRESIKTESQQSILNSRKIREEEASTKRAEHYKNVFGEREKRESIKTESQQSILNSRKIREEEAKRRIEEQKNKNKTGKYDEMFRNIRSISFSSGKSASGIVSLVSKMGSLGMVLGTVGAAAYGLMKVVSWAGNTTIGYAANALGAEGYTAGGIAALRSGVVPGVNKDIGNNIADAISSNSQILSSKYLPRQAIVASKALQGVAMFTGGDTSGIRNLLNVRKNASEKDIYSMVFSDIRAYMKNKNPNAAIGLGEKFGLSREAILAGQFTDINKGITQIGNSDGWKNFDNLTQAALRQTSAIDHLTGQINKLAEVITRTISNIHNSNISKGTFIEKQWNNPYPLESFIFSAPGNSSKGLK